jgi:hypothetical protein
MWRENWNKNLKRPTHKLPWCFFFSFFLSRMRLTFHCEMLRMSEWNQDEENKREVRGNSRVIFYFFATRCDKKFNEGRRALFWDFWLFFSHSLLKCRGERRWRRKKKYNFLTNEKEWNTKKGREREREWRKASAAERRVSERNEWKKMLKTFLLFCEIFFSSSFFVFRSDVDELSSLIYDVQTSNIGNCYTKNVFVFETFWRVCAVLCAVMYSALQSLFFFPHSFSFCIFFRRIFFFFNFEDMKKRRYI